MPIPFACSEVLREHYPCYWSESGRLWILSRYDDIGPRAPDWETFSSSQGDMIDELPGRAARWERPIRLVAIVACGR